MKNNKPNKIERGANKLGNWIKEHKMLSVVILMAIVIIGGVASNEEQKEIENETKEVTKADKSKEEKVEEPTEEIAKADDVDVVPVDETVDEGVSDEFRESANNYFSRLGMSYTTLGEWTNADNMTPTEMMDVVKEAQSYYDDANEFFVELDPQNEKEEELFSKITEIDNLAMSALLDAEVGLDAMDPSYLDNAAINIEQSGNISEEVIAELEE